jgi:hypothetical protein
MGHSGIPSCYSRFVLAGLAHAFFFCVFMGLVMIFEPRMRANNGHGWDVFNGCLAVVAVALFVVGIFLLAWRFSRHLPSRPKDKLSAQTFQPAGVWDRQFDG